MSLFETPLAPEPKGFPSVQKTSTMKSERIEVQANPDWKGYERVLFKIVIYLFRQCLLIGNITKRFSQLSG
jgi:hypothetical protein